MGTHDSELVDHAREAIRLSREHVAQGGIPFTGVIVGSGGRILGTGVNRVREDNDPTAHAEIVALREATAKHGIRAVAGATLIASGEPCALCYLAALYAGIGRVAHAADRGTAARYGFDYTNSYSIFAQDPASWPFEVTALQLPEAEVPFQDFLTMSRARR